MKQKLTVNSQCSKTLDSLPFLFSFLSSQKDLEKDFPKRKKQNNKKEQQQQQQNKQKWDRALN